MNVDLFRKRWIGPPGVPWCAFCIVYFDLWDRKEMQRTLGTVGSGSFLGCPKIKRLVSKSPHLVSSRFLPLSSFFFECINRSMHKSHHISCDLAHVGIRMKISAKIFPILCHGDDAESHRRRSFTVVTMASPLTGGKSSWDLRFLLYVMDVSRAITETYDTLDSWLVYGLTELQEGRFMNVDLYGNPCERKVSGPICGPFKGVLFGLKGDQKYLQRALKLKTSWVSESCCMYCGATNSGPLVYTSFGEHAPHRATLQTTHGFMTHGCAPNAWLRLPGFSLSMVLTDWLHLVDLALTPEVSASVAHINFENFGNLFFLLVYQVACQFTDIHLFCHCQGFGGTHTITWGVERWHGGWEAAFGVCGFHKGMQTAWSQHPGCNLVRATRDKYRQLTFPEYDQEIGGKCTVCILAGKLCFLEIH